ncbi:MAG: hypothetical protein WDN69_30865 [Aliidongia sp.]
MTPRKLDTHVDWHAEDVADPARWTVTLTEQDHKELDHALVQAKRISEDLLEIDRAAFPLDRLADKIGGRRTRADRRPRLRPHRRPRYRALQ